MEISIGCLPTTSNCRVELMKGSVKFLLTYEFIETSELLHLSNIQNLRSLHTPLEENTR